VTPNTDIIWLSRLLTFGIPEEGFNSNSSYALNKSSEKKTQKTHTHATQHRKLNRCAKLTPQTNRGDARWSDQEG